MSYEAPCAICEQPVNLEESKTDEHGHAVHENCYIWTVELKKPGKRKTQTDARTWTLRLSPSRIGCLLPCSCTIQTVRRVIAAPSGDAFFESTLLGFGKGGNEEGVILGIAKRDFAALDSSFLVL
jgi:hypothetical protein